MDEEKLEQLAASVAEHKLLEAIVVPRAEARLQIIAGRRRTAAMRHLHGRAQTDEEHQEYARIRAEENPEVDAFGWRSSGWHRLDSVSDAEEAALRLALTDVMARVSP